MPTRPDTAPPQPVPQPATQPLTRALLVCTDTTARRWGPRWLEHAGFEVTLCTRPAEAIDAGNAVKPAMIVVEASLRDSHGATVYPQLQQSCNGASLIVLCATTREVQTAVEYDDIADVVRKPFDWQVISRRARQIADWRRRNGALDEVRTELASARIEVSELRRDLSRNAEIDPLTGLPTRNRFRRIIGQTLLSQHAGRSNVLVVVIRMNRFHLVNEALGHDSGNDVLLEISRRLRATLGQRASVGKGFVTAAVARLGGIRFGIALSGVGDIERVRKLGSTLLAQLAEPVRIGDQTLYLSASIGGALYPMDGDGTDQLLQHAESAAAEARQRGGGFRLFREPLVAGSARLLHLNSLLHEAIDDNQLRVEYQPILDVAESRVVGAEALLRWHHPQEGPISPSEFVPVAEKSGLMPQIGAFVLDRACRQLREWLESGAGGLRMAINLSLYELQHSDVVDTVGRALTTWGIEPARIELELSERGVVGRDTEVLRQLHLLKSLGVRLSIDDFGTGDASIAYLKELPIDALKIDRSYVSGASIDGRDATIAAAMAALARQLGLTVIAEGVETAAQLELLRIWGCHQYQGFYFSPSVAAGRFLPLAARANQRIAASDGHVPGFA